MFESCFVKISCVPRFWDEAIHPQFSSGGVKSSWSAEVPHCVDSSDVRQQANKLFFLLLSLKNMVVHLVTV